MLAFDVDPNEVADKQQNGARDLRLRVLSNLEMKNGP